MKRQRGRGRRSGGGNNNNPNKHFESNGPDVKIRGSAQQILDKYQQYARDAQTSGDRVNAENYLQHAEHYHRLLAAMQPKDKPREQRPNEEGGGAEAATETGEGAPTTSEEPAETRSENAREGGGRNRGRGRGRDREERQQAESDKPVESAAPDTDAPVAEESAPVAEKPKRRRTYKKKDAEPAAASDDGEDGVMKTLSRGRKKAAPAEAEAAADGVDGPSAEPANQE